jgi:hypothetical protein
VGYWVIIREFPGTEGSENDNGSIQITLAIDRDSVLYQALFYFNNSKSLHIP